MSLSTQQIEQLIQSGESSKVEFKSDQNAALSDREIYEIIVCFANTDGGTLIIGVENDGSITGLGKNREPFRLQAAIFNNTVPSINTRINQHTIQSKEILAIEVDAYPQICATSEGKCLHRVNGATGPECRPYYPYEQTNRAFNLGLADFSSQTLEQASWPDLDPLEFERVRQTITQLHGDTNLLSLDDNELAQALRLVESRNGTLVPNIAGLLILGRESSLLKLVPTHQIAVQVMDSDGTIQVNDWLRAPLIKSIEHIYGRFQALNRQKEAEFGFLRLPIPDYAPESFREAVMNALLHRDYSRLDAIYIQFHPDHMFISNPGGFLEGITVENLLVHEPKPRNPLLAEVLRRLGLVETTGRGIDKIYWGQLRYGRSLPEYSGSTSEAVRLVLQGGEASLQFAKFVAEQDQAGHPLTLDDLLILNHLQFVRRVNTVDIGNLTQRGENHARSIAEKLVERGLIEPKGEKKGRVYHLSASLYKLLGKTSGYIRTRGLDRIQQETMILQLMGETGRITRKEVMELCKLTGPQATKLLGKLESENRVKRYGFKRGTHYVLA